MQNQVNQTQSQVTTLQGTVQKQGDETKQAVGDLDRQVATADEKATDAGRKAAEAAEAAREQGKYWEYVALLYKNQSALQVDRLKQYASTLGLDRARFDTALDSGKFADKILRDRLDGQKVGVSSAPTFFVNGRRVSDLTYEGLKTAIETNLKTR